MDEVKIYMMYHEPNASQSLGQNHSVECGLLGQKENSAHQEMSVYVSGSTSDGYTHIWFDITVDEAMFMARLNG